MNIHPRLSVNPFCSITNTFAEDLALWRTIGVPRAGVTSRKMAAHGWQRALDDIDTAGLNVPYLVHGIYTPVNRADDWQRDEQDLLIEATRVTATLGARFVYLCTGPAGGLLWEEAADEFEHRMAPVLEVAREVGVRIAIENNHTSRPELGFVFSIADASVWHGASEWGSASTCTAVGSNEHSAMHSATTWISSISFR